MTEPEDERRRVASPCIGVCRMNASGYCAGCLRTLHEIAQWGSSSETRRREILSRIAQRRKELSSAKQAR